jgi:putative PIN family toxin of toxin-antitoxin system
MSRPPDPPAVVFDCMIFLQAIANDESPAARALDLVESGEIKLCVSEQILRELRRVLDRPEVRSALPGINDLRVESLFRRLEKKAVTIKEVPRVFEYPRDPNDEPYINLAIAARAKYLVSRDKDLLDLMIATDLESKQFRQRFRVLRIIDPADLLHEIKVSATESE